MDFCPKVLSVMKYPRAFRGSLLAVTVVNIAYVGGNRLRVDSVRKFYSAVGPQQTQSLPVSTAAVRHVPRPYVGVLGGTAHSFHYVAHLVVVPVPTVYLLCRGLTGRWKRSCLSFHSCDIFSNELAAKAHT